MRKLWNHYDPLPFDTIPELPEEEHIELEPLKKSNRFWGKVRDWLFRTEETEQKPAKLFVGLGIRRRMQIRTPDIHADVREALCRWKQAEAYFDSVSDPALVDYAAYDLQAAQRRYIYLLKQAEGSGGERVSASSFLPL